MVSLSLSLSLSLIRVFVRICSWNAHFLCVYNQNLLALKYLKTVYSTKHTRTSNDDNNISINIKLITKKNWSLSFFFIVFYTERNNLLTGQFVFENIRF